MTYLIAKDGRQWPGPFPAVQWRGDLGPFSRFLEKDEKLFFAAGRLYVMDDDRNTYEPELGGWIIRDGGGVLRMASDGEVQTCYHVREGDLS
jgi:hypothetical protein